MVPGWKLPDWRGLTDARLDGSSQAVTRRKSSFGQRLIRELTGQLGGEMSLTSRHGTYFRLWIPSLAGPI